MAPLGSTIWSPVEVKTVRWCRGDHRLGRLEPQPERRGGVVARAGGDRDTGAGLARALVRGQHARQRRVVAQRLLEQVVAVLAGEGGVVAGARGVAAVGDRLGAGAEQPRRQPVVREQDAGHLPGQVGVVLGQPASLPTVNEATGTLPTVSAQKSAPRSATRPRGLRRAAGVVPQQRVEDRPGVGVEGEHAVLLGGDRDRRDAGELGAAGRLEGGPPALGVDRRAVGVRGATAAPGPRRCRHRRAAPCSTAWRSRCRDDDRALAVTRGQASSVARAPSRWQRRQCLGVRRGEALVVDEVTEERRVAQEGQRVARLLLRGRGHHAVAAPVDDLDRLALLVDALGVARPAGDDQRATGDLTAVCARLRADHRQQPLGDAVGALGAQPGQRVADLGVGEALDQLVLVVVEVDARHRRQRRRGLAVHVAEQEVDEERVLARPRGRSGSRPGSRGSTAPGGWR